MTAQPSYASVLPKVLHGPSMILGFLPSLDGAKVTALSGSRNTIWAGSRIATNYSSDGGGSERFVY